MVRRTPVEVPSCTDGRAPAEAPAGGRVPGGPRAGAPRSELDRRRPRGLPARAASALGVDPYEAQTPGPVFSAPTVPPVRDGRLRGVSVLAASTSTRSRRRGCGRRRAVAGRGTPTGGTPSAGRHHTAVEAAEAARERVARLAAVRQRRRPRRARPALAECPAESQEPEVPTPCRPGRRDAPGGDARDMLEVCTVDDGPTAPARRTPVTADRERGRRAARSAPELGWLDGGAGCAGGPRADGAPRTTGRRPRCRGS